MTYKSGNMLYYGDNLDILKRYIKDETVDLVYLDPPFNSNANYNILFEEKDGTKAASQIQAFTDTWTWNQESESVYADIVLSGGRVSDCLQAFRTFLHECDLLAYLVMMAPRLVELQRVMKPTASIYLHCDPTASHYLKLIMDAVFGVKNFRNEIVWCYSGGGIPTRDFPRKHDIIFRYTKGNQWTYQHEYRPYNELTAQRMQYIHKGIMVDTDRGTPVTDWWTDIKRPTGPRNKERLGYPTQKPVALLERIINTSCPDKGVVLDPFCGCGTTIAAAQKLGRPWIGIDITHLAINLIKIRLNDSFTEPVKYNVVGEPVSIEDAKRLAESEPFQFQAWALGLVGARVATSDRKGADKGIDGKIVFEGDKKGVFESVILSVKAGKTGSAHVRDLKGVIEREKAAIGVLISMQDDKKPMKVEAATAGFYESSLWGKKYPKIQILTVAELLDGKKLDMPPIKQVNVTFKKASKTTNNLDEQPEMDI
jgi:DNA modification methylase